MPEFVIDRLLREADWDIENKSAVATEEAAAEGRADYLLKNSRTRPLCVVETKRFSVDPYSAKTQTKEYAVSLGAPFIVSSGRRNIFRKPSLARPTLVRRGSCPRRAWNNCRASH